MDAEKTVEAVFLYVFGIGNRERGEGGTVQWANFIRYPHINIWVLSIHSHRQDPKLTYHRAVG